MSSALWVSVGRVGIVLLVGLVCTLLLRLSLREGAKLLRQSGMGVDRLKRLTTLLNAGRSIGHLSILLIVVLMILHELGINITPILASAGIVGLAFSLGAQTVIKDFLGGIIILIENQFTIDDVIQIGQLTGTVERIALRATYMRDIEGRLNLIPNGDIRTVSNLTTQWAQAVITFNVDYEADMARALQALTEAALIVQEDKEIAPAILESPSVFGWTGFTDWAVQAQIYVKTRPGQQWPVARALRKAALELLHREGICVAVPRQRIESMSNDPVRSQATS